MVNKGKDSKETKIAARRNSSNAFMKALVKSAGRCSVSQTAKTALRIEWAQTSCDKQCCSHSDLSDVTSEVPKVRITVRSIPGDILAQVDLRENSTLAQLKEVVHFSLGTPRELLRIVIDVGDTPVSDNMSLYDAGFREEGKVICETLKKPQGYDTVGDCAGCHNYRHLFYGYARCHPDAELEPVTAMCQACGGRPQNLDDDD